MNKNKLIVLLSLCLTSLSVSAWDDSRKDRYGNRNDNTPKSYTLSGDSYGSRSKSLRESDSYTSRRSNEDSQGTSGAYRNDNQINNNGLIINRE
jgi:hypothetical protein